MVQGVYAWAGGRGRRDEGDTSCYPWTNGHVAKYL